MALGTPVSRGTASRSSFGTGDISIPSFTPASDALLVATVIIFGTGSNVPDSIVGQDAGITWVQVGSTEQAGTRFSKSLWIAAAGSSPSAGVVTAKWSVSGLMSINVHEVTGADVSGTAANTLKQIDSGSGYGTSLVRSLPSATDLTMGFWSINQIPTLTPEGTETLNYTYFYNGKRTSVDHDTAGDATPTCTSSSNNDHASFAVEVKPAGAPPAANDGAAVYHYMRMMGVYG